jgi:hypothetical protein
LHQRLPSTIAQINTLFFRSHLKNVFLVGA